jgi:hypothetical protein
MGGEPSPTKAGQPRSIAADIRAFLHFFGPEEDFRALEAQLSDRLGELDRGSLVAIRSELHQRSLNDREASLIFEIDQRIAEQTF